MEQMAPKGGELAGDGAGSGQGEELQEFLKEAGKEGKKRGAQFGTALRFSSALVSDEKRSRLLELPHFCHISATFPSTFDVGREYGAGGQCGNFCQGLGTASTW